MKEEKRIISLYKDKCDSCGREENMIRDSKYPSTMPDYVGKTVWWCSKCKSPNFRGKDGTNQEEKGTTSS